MKTHASIDDLLAVRGRELPDRELRMILDHVAGCPECSALATRALSLDNASIGLTEQILGVDEHLLVDEELYPYVEGTLQDDALARAERHVASCSTCQAEVEDLRAARRSLTRSPDAGRWQFMAAAAAALVLLVSIAVVFSTSRRHFPSTSVRPRAITRATPANDRDAHGSAAFDGEALDPPPLYLSLLSGPGQTRGSDSPRSSARALHPVGEIVESSRPLFSWTSVPDAVYNVSVYRGLRPVASSGELHSTSWTPPVDLRRGATYTWQIRVRARGSSVVIPLPTQPMAMFAVLSEGAESQLEEARRSRPDDHRSLGVLYARLGMLEDARSEIRKAAADPAQRDRVTPLLESLDRWPTSQ